MSTHTSEAVDAGHTFIRLDVAGLLARLHQLAQTQPNAIALLHKRLGRWNAWRWSDLPNWLVHVSDQLARQGVTMESRIAVTGALEPQLLITALAAYRLGAEVFEVGPQLRSQALAERLRVISPTHAFVSARLALPDWLQSSDVSANPVILFLPELDSQTGRVENVQWQQIALTDPAHVGSSLHSSLQRLLRAQPTLWVEEGSEWPGGIAQVLAQWLTSAALLAAPEVTHAAARDRQEVAPVRVLASPLRREQWRTQLLDRLPVSGWLSARIVAALESPQQWVRAGLYRRLARLNGLPLDEVRALLQAPPQIPAPALPVNGNAASAATEAFA